MNEFDLELGSLKKALGSATGAVVQFIIGPLLATILISSLLSGSSSAAVQHLGRLIGDYSFYIIVLGAVLVALSALKGYYPKGSRSRLTFDLAMIPFYLLLLWAFDMGGSMGPAFNAAAFPLQLDLVLWLFTLFIVFKSLYKVADYIDSRRSFLVKLARTYPGITLPPARPVEDPALHRLSQDFHPRYGRFLSGMAEADRSLLQYVIFPMLIIIVVGAIIQSTQGFLESMTGTAGADATSLFGLGSATLDRLSTLLLFIGLPIAVMSFFKGFYPKGSVSRLTFALIVVALVCAWIYFAALGGHLSVSMNVLGSPIHFDLNYVALLWLFIFAAALWGVYWAVEAYIYRKVWKKNGFIPEDEVVRNGQRSRHWAQDREGRNEEE